LVTRKSAIGVIGSYYSGNNQIVSSIDSIILFTASDSKKEMNNTQ